MHAKLKIVVSILVNDEVVDRRRIDLEIDDSDLHRGFTWHSLDVKARDREDGHPIAITGRTEVELMEFEADVAAQA